jgi:hypothetical protein
VDDTQTEKSGKYMEFIHKLFDHAKKRYIFGYNPVLILAVFGDLVFPLSLMLWLPQSHPQHRSKNDLAGDFLAHLQGESERRGCSLSEVEILFDSAYCVQKVVCKAKQADVTVISKPNSNHKFEFNGQLLTPKEIIEQVKEGSWKFLGKANDHQRYVTTHAVYGSVVLIVRRKVLKNRKIAYDIVMCTKVVYNGFQINKRYQKRWEIELHFKYYKQYLQLGKGQGGKLNTIQSQLYCVALVGLVVALFRHQLPRKVSFRTATKRITSRIYDG